MIGPQYQPNVLIDLHLLKSRKKPLRNCLRQSGNLPKCPLWHSFEHLEHVNHLLNNNVNLCFDFPPSTSLLIFAALECTVC